jgi:hypothetical protein
LPAGAFFSTGKARMILPHAMIFIAQRQAKRNRPNLTFGEKFGQGVGG